MADAPSGFWGYRVLFVLLASLLVFIQLLPLDPGPGQFPGPDILLLLALFWTVVRPALLPVWLLAVVFLASDLLLMRPPGLWTALAILGCEFLRSRRAVLRNAPFPVEWALLAVVITAMTVANALILSIFAVPQPSFGLTVIRMVFTIAVYPLVVILAGRAIGLSKPRGEREALGVRR
ncbi:MAG: rod shape-determining protein MreD [Pseudomonadota bacterium]